MKWLNNQWKQDKLSVICVALAITFLIYLFFFDRESLIQIQLSGRVAVESN